MKHRIYLIFLIFILIFVNIAFSAPLAEDTGTISTGQPLSGDINVTSNTTQPDGTSCTSASQCANGYCVHNICRSLSTYCGDGYCDSGESCSADNSGCSSGYSCTNGCVGAAPSGGGGTIPTETTQTFETVTPTTPATVIVGASDAAELKVDEVSMDVKETVSNVKITIRESSKPAAANVAISSDIGATYKYLEITTNIENAKIEKVKIKFKVEKSWIDKNNISASTIALNRYADGTWNKLPTTQTGEDATYYYFEAETPWLSIFAITGEKKKVAVCGNNVKEGTEECDGSDLSGQTCQSQGYIGGTLKCMDCRFDTSGCTPSVCGNNIKEGTEECDGTDLSGQTCVSKGFTGGTLKCAIGCKFDSNECTTAPPVCGDGTCDASETALTCPADCKPTEIPEYYYVISIIVIIIIIGGLYYWFTGKAKKL